MRDVLIVGAGPAGISAALKCANYGYDVLVVEKEGRGGSKPCGGLISLPCFELLSRELGLKLPTRVFSKPRELGLFYVPPSGKENGGAPKGRKLFNVDRGSFDGWLRSVAESRGIPILFNARLMGFQKERGCVKAFVKSESGGLKFNAKCLIGADGVFSIVRNELSPAEFSVTAILQEYWVAEGDFAENFYMVFGEGVTPTYGYVIPKDGLLVLGTGVPSWRLGELQRLLNGLKRRLALEFGFKPLYLKKREVGFIPGGSVFAGEGNVILVGDAGGFCNPFTGEGIRFAIESGLSAGEALKQARERANLAAAYRERMEGTVSFILKMRTFSLSFGDEAAEELVRFELG